MAGAGARAAFGASDPKNKDLGANPARRFRRPSRPGTLTPNPYRRSTGSRVHPVDARPVRCRCNDPPFDGQGWRPPTEPSFRGGPAGSSSTGSAMAFLLL